MSTKQFVAYYRVSTQKQGNSGLGLEAQENAVANHLKENDCELMAAFTEIETGKGANALEKRPQLRSALNLCRKSGATLIIAKLDRLARNVHFVSGLIESGCDFIASDMPHANKVMIQMHAVMSEWERDQISLRTKNALRVAKQRGIVLGVSGPANLKSNIEKRKLDSLNFALKLSSLIKSFQAIKMSQRDIVSQLNILNIKTIKGNEWSLVQLQRVISKI